MRINKVHLKNFKRFTDLTLGNIPSASKLVLLIGANGSGKSCVFDGFQYLRGQQTGRHSSSEFGVSDYYYRKISDGKIELEVVGNDGKALARFDETANLFVSAPFLADLIGRSSIRILPKLYLGGDTTKIENDQDAPETFIENDERFINDVNLYIQQIDNALREPVFSGKSADTFKIFQDFIKPFNVSLSNIFGESVATTIQLIEFQNATLSPPSAAQLVFKKGQSRIHYDLLSHGEKQVVILLLNFIVRRSQYEDAIIFIDEMDCHLNTSLQSRLLDEIVTKWIPDSSQLWTASHALGFIDYARNSEQAVILDFDNLNFDVPQVIQPQPKDNLDVYEIAVPKSIVFDIFKGKKTILCENQNDEYYNMAQIPDVIFVGVKDARDVFINVKRDSRYYSLRDRDFLSDTEIDKIHKAYPNHNILRYYDFENYLYHPENISELNIVDFDIVAYSNEITKQKNTRVDYILPTLVSSRQGYEEFKTNDKLKDENVNSIVDDLKSDDFERFYKYFDMKVEFKKDILSQLNIDKKDLVKTKWFKQQIEVVLNS